MQLPFQNQKSSTCLLFLNESVCIWVVGRLHSPPRMRLAPPQREWLFIFCKISFQKGCRLGNLDICHLLCYFQAIFFLTPGKAETAGLVGLCLCPHWRWGCAVGFHEKMSLLHVKCVPRGEVALKMLGDRVQGS